MPIDLGENTPEKNSSSAAATGNPLVVSNAVDGAGAVVKLSSIGTNSAVELFGQPGLSVPTPTAGSVRIRLTDCAGQDLYIQPLPICLNGVSGTIYILCSSFVPDP